MAGWMSGGTKGIKSRWVTIVVEREKLEEQHYTQNSAEFDGYITTREVIEAVGGRIYGE